MVGWGFWFFTKCLLRNTLVFIYSIHTGSIHIILQSTTEVCTITTWIEKWLGSNIESWRWSKQTYPIKPHKLLNRLLPNWSFDPKIGIFYQIKSLWELEYWYKNRQILSKNRNIWYEFKNILYKNWNIWFNIMNIWSKNRTIS